MANCALIRRISAGNSRPLAERFGRRSAPRSLPFCARRYHTPRYHAMTAFIGYYYGMTGCNLRNCWEFTARLDRTLPRCQFVCIAGAFCQITWPILLLFAERTQNRQDRVGESSGFLPHCEAFPPRLQQIGSHGPFFQRPFDSPALGNLCYPALLKCHRRAIRCVTDHSASTASSLLSSRDNRWLKEFRMALRGGLPTESGAVGVEGPRLVEEALRSASPVRAVLFSESGERHHARLRAIPRSP